MTRTKNWGTEVLTDTDLEGQFDLIIDWLMAALNESTGHKHDGTENEGPQLATDGLANDAVTFAKIDDDGDFGPLTGLWSWSTAIRLIGASPIILEGATDDASETTIAVTDPTADRTLTIPNEDVNLGQQCIKGWVRFDGSGSITVNDSFNVTSITDNGTGLYTVNWSVAFANANYAVVVSCNSAEATTSSMSTTAASIGTANSSGTNADSATISVIAIGDR